MKFAKRCFWLMLRICELQNLYVSWVLKWDCQKIEQGLRHGLNPNRKNAGDDMTLLCNAIAKGKITAAQLLLQNGANPNAKATLGKTPLFMAVENGDPQAVTLLAEAGADVNFENKMGLSPLGWCVIEYLGNQQEGRADKCAHILECAKVLLNHGAAADHYSRKTDLSPLMMCAEKELPELFALFLQSGADPLKPNSIDVSPASLIQKRNQQTLAKLLPARAPSSAHGLSSI